MRFKTAIRLRPQPARLSCQVSTSENSECGAQSFQQSIDSLVSINYLESSSISSQQQGRSNLILVLFIVAVLVTAVVGLMFGNKLGYQRGYYSMQNETKQANINSDQATKELDDLRLSHKILASQVATAKQELTISLANLDDLRENQQTLKIENEQFAQLNDLYASVISEKGGLPLQILGAKIEPLPENAFEYGFDIAMLSSSEKSNTVVATLTLLNDDDFVEVPLDSSRYSVEGIERIRGRFVMPSDFKPLQIKLNLSSGGQEVEQLYDWKLGDMVDSMPLSLLDLPEVDESPIVLKPSTVK